jgi:hypothetical protein
MAATLYIAGPTVVEWQSAQGQAWAVLGYSDNDNLPAVQFTDNHHEVKTVLSGAVPEEVVLLGMTARISVALVKWDGSELEALTDWQRSATGSAVVGRRIVADNAWVAIRIASIGNSQTYSFMRCYLQTDSIGDSQWGNRERVLTLAFTAIPDADGAVYSQTGVTP